MGCHECETKRNETIRNGMEQNDDRRHSTSACNLQSVQLFALAPHIRFLFSPTLCPSHSLSFSSVSLELLFCASGRQLQQFASAAFVHKKKESR